MPIRPLRTPAILALGLVAVALVAAACQVLPGPVTPGVEGTGWRATEIRGRAPVAGAEPTIAFAKGRIGGTTGCNSYGGEARIDGARFEVGEIATTLIGCEPEISEMEAHFSLALGSATSITIRPDGMLVLSGADGDIVFRPDAAVVLPD